MAALSATQRGLWGTLTVDGMLAHVAQATRMALGDIDVPSKGSWLFRTYVMKRLILDAIPFPKGAPTARALLERDTSTFEPLRAEVLALLGRVADGPRDGMGPTHPLFGPLTRAEWAKLAYKHTDHHLRQFGV